MMLAFAKRLFAQFEMDLSGPFRTFFIVPPSPMNGDAPDDGDVCSP